MTVGSGLTSPGHLQCVHAVQGEVSRPLWIATVDCGTLVNDELTAGGVPVTGLGDAAVYTDASATDGYEELLVQAGSLCAEFIEYRGLGTMREALVQIATFVVPRLVASPPPG